MIFGTKTEPPRGAAAPIVTRKRHVRELYNPDQMVAVLRRERARSDRQHCAFSIVLFHLDEIPFKPRSLLRLATILLRSIRETDELGCYDAQTLCAVLPDTGPAGASMLVARVRKATLHKPYQPTCTIYTYPDPPSTDTEPVDRSAQRRMPPRSDGDNTSLGLCGRPSQRVRHDLQDQMNRLARADFEYSPAAPHPEAPYRQTDDAELNSGTSSVGVLEALAPEPSPQSVEQMTSEIREILAKSPVHAMSELFAEPLPLWKRALDVAAATTALIVTSPLMIGAALAIRLSSPGPVIFKQKRTGLGGQTFLIYKFRTMCIDAEKKQQHLRAISEQDGPAFKLTNDPRVFPVGRFLRKTSIDELPQLFNVLKGDMTLVGPRPLPVHEADACKQWQQRRHDVTPGLTCIWQVEGRSRVKFEEWMRMDMRYARRRNLLKDLTLVFKTIPAVLLRRGAQ
jgi:lipopolysaccharide/colanic/teichoic acid biosynthesis glycosyltransferase